MASDVFVEVDAVEVLGETIVALVRPLLMLEWPIEWPSRVPHHPVTRRCALCNEDRPTHAGRCPVEIGLTASGLDTQQKRDAARGRLRDGK